MPSTSAIKKTARKGDTTQAKITHPASGNGFSAGPYPQELVVGGNPTGVFVKPDAFWPSMWRVYDRAGVMSDMVNLSRAREAARSYAGSSDGGLHGNVETWVERKRGACRHVA